MMEFLADVGLPTVVALTKADKVKDRELPARAAEAAGALGVDESQVIPFSAVTGRGRDELAAAIVALLDQPSWRSQ